MLLWTAALVDFIRRNGLSGWATFGWMLLTLNLPIVGSLIYFIARPAAVDTSGLEYEPRPATGVSIAEKTQRLGKLTERGTIDSSRVQPPEGSAACLTWS
jgi:Phospholipase_D-nuclease N-terminal